MAQGQGDGCRDIIPDWGTSIFKFIKKFKYMDYGVMAIEGKTKTLFRKADGDILKTTLDGAISIAKERAGDYISAIFCVVSLDRCGDISKILHKYKLTFGEESGVAEVT